MEEYKKLKTELKEIAKILKDYPESLQPQVFDMLTSQFLGDSPIRKNPKVIEKSSTPKTNRKSTPKGKGSETKSKTSSKQSFSIVKSLSLKGNSKVKSFKEFCELYDTKSGIKFNVVAVYYLKRILKEDNVGLDHIYTCYKEVGKKTPGNLKMSVYNCSGPKYGYLDASNVNDLKIPTSGEDFVEHDLLISKAK